jgi:hypothetical protein
MEHIKLANVNCYLRYVDLNCSIDCLAESVVTNAIFTGYYVMPGPSHTVPSEIVAKIIEKLREHERENIPPPSVASAPVIGNNETSSPSLPTASSKFSRAARHVLTRTTVLGALPFIARCQSCHSTIFFFKFSPKREAEV